MTDEPRWNWAALHAESSKFTLSKSATVIDCWKYEHDEDESEVRAIDDEAIEDWANLPTPTRDGQLPRAGLRLIHKGVSFRNENPFTTTGLAAINKAFNLPRVDLSPASRRSGACGRLFIDHLKPGKFGLQFSDLRDL